MPSETIDVDAERGLIAQLFERPQTVAMLYAALHIDPKRIDLAAQQLVTLQIIESSRHGLALSPAMRHLDQLDLLHL
jgi:hypothetical protein